MKWRKAVPRGVGVGVGVDVGVDVDGIVVLLGTVQTTMVVLAWLIDALTEASRLGS